VDVHPRRGKRKAQTCKSPPKSPPVKKLAVRRSPRHVAAEPVMIEDDNSNREVGEVPPALAGKSGKGNHSSLLCILAFSFLT